MCCDHVRVKFEPCMVDQVWVKIDQARTKYERSRVNSKPLDFYKYYLRIYEEPKYKLRHYMACELSLLEHSVHDTVLR
jgi:hypothetical protein